MLNFNINYFTLQPYGGKNFERLETAKTVNGWTSNKWMTFLQAKKNYIKIKKGAKATEILIPAGTITEKNTDAEGNTTEEKKTKYQKCYVFNEEQTESTKKAEQKTEVKEVKAETKTEIKAEPKQAELPKMTEPETKKEADDLISKLQKMFK